MSELMALDGKEYRAWIGELNKRYRATQIKAAVAVNSAMIEFYWNLGKDISEKYPGKVRDAEFFKRLSNDLRLTIPNATGLSITNIKYARYFFELYVDESYRPQVVDDCLLKRRDCKNAGSILCFAERTPLLQVC